MEATAKISQRHEIKLPQLNNYLDEVTYISFPSFEEFCKLAKIELFFKKIEKARNDRDRVRKYLERINKYVNDCKRIMIFSNEKTSFEHLLTFITVFLYEMKFHYESYECEKDLQNQIASKLRRKIIMCSPNFF